MAKTFNIIPIRGMERIHVAHERDQQTGIVFDGNDDTVEITYDQYNTPRVELISDYRKENVITTAATGNPTGSTYVTLSISHGANNTTNNSVLTIDISGLTSTIATLQSQLSTAQSNISTLQSQVSSLDSRVTALGG